jgi:hypothetical protein
MIIFCFSVSIDQFIQNLIDIAVQNQDTQKRVNLPFCFNFAVN